MPIGTIKVVATISGNIPRTCYNIWHFSVSDTTTPIAQKAVDFLRDFYTTALTLFPTGTNIVVGSSVQVISTNPPLILGPTPRTVAGGGGSQAAPAQLANVVSWRTPFAGRSFRGRTYLGPIAYASLNGNVLTTAVATAVQNAANNLVAAMASDVDLELVVWSEKLTSQSTIISGVSNTKVETQRRRNR